MGSWILLTGINWQYIHVFHMIQGFQFCVLGVGKSQASALYYKTRDPHNAYHWACVPHFYIKRLLREQAVTYKYTYIHIWVLKV